MTFKESGLRPKDIIDILSSREEGKFTATSAEMILRDVVSGEKEAWQVMEQTDIAKIEDENIIENAVKSAIKENQKATADYRYGKSEALNFVVGQVMRKTRGRADPATVRKMLKDQLGEPEKK